MSATYSPERATAVHEAGHAVASYLLGRRFTKITVVEDGDALGQVAHRAPGDWFRPDIEVNARARRLIEDHIMISIAGYETEAAWLSTVPGAPDNWPMVVEIGASHDRGNVVNLALYGTGGSTREAEAYIEWLAERVRNWTGRPNDAESGPPNERFWWLVERLADAAQKHGTLSWRNARDVLRGADGDRLDAMKAEHQARWQAATKSR